MSREGPYLPIDTKINLENLGGCNNPPWLDVLQKIAWLDEGKTVAIFSFTKSYIQIILWL